MSFLSDKGGHGTKKGVQVGGAAFGSNMALNKDAQNSDISFEVGPPSRDNSVRSFELFGRVGIKDAKSVAAAEQKHSSANKAEVQMVKAVDQYGINPAGDPSVPRSLPRNIESDWLKSLH